MRILHVIAGIRKIAGTSVFVCELAREQVQLGHHVDIVHEEVWRKDNYPLDERVKLIGKKDFLKMVDNREYDIVHIHGLWKWMLHTFTNLAVKKGWPIVWSPHGSITPWAMKFKAWKKIPAWWLWQKWDIRKAKLLHVTAPCEEKWVRDYGFSQPCITAPLGVEVSKNVIQCKHGGGGGNAFRQQGAPQKGTGYATQGDSGSERMKVMKFIGRVSPTKGLPDLLRAFDIEGWKLRIVGPDENNHIAELKELAETLGISGKVEFVGPKSGGELAEEYATADLFVLPTYSENFGSVVIESLAQGVPVICTKGAPWKELEEYGCGWWPDVGVAALREAIEKATSLTAEERREMGERGRKLVEEKYTWERVCETVMRGYESVLDARSA